MKTYQISEKDIKYGGKEMFKELGYKKSKYEILKDGFGLICIKDKPYYYVVGKGFCIVEFDEWDFSDNNYIKIKYDPITGKKLIIDNELRQFIKLEKKQIAKRKAEIKYMNTQRVMKEKEYKKSLIEEFGEIEANKILSIDDNITSFSGMFSECKPLTDIPVFETERSKYIEKLRKGE